MPRAYRFVRRLRSETFPDKINAVTFFQTLDDQRPMPANLTPAYRKAEQDFRKAKTTEEKIACLEAMLRLIPKHKGTDHMQGDIKRRLSRLRKEQERGRSKGKKTAPVFKVEREGAAQVVLLGAPNAGKSQILASLSKAHATVAPYPFATQIPLPGMVKFEDIQIQLVDTPPITSDYMEPWLPDIVRRSDAALIVSDMGSDDALHDVETLLSRLAKVKIELVRELPENVENRVETFRRTVLVANKTDTPDADNRLTMLREFFGKRFEIWPLTATGGDALDNFAERLFRFIRIIRVYTKQPGKKPDMNQPYTIAAGSTVIEVAVKVHRDFEKTLKSARLWGSGKYDGIYVKRDHVLDDGDIIELHE